MGAADVLVVLCHPLPGSLNHAAADRALTALAEHGRTARFHDLYAEGFDPVLAADELQRGVSLDQGVLEHTRELSTCSGLILVHPDWWGLPPALLKGWIDRVFRPGVAYELEGEEFLRKDEAPLLGGKRALVFATTDASPEDDPGLLERYWLHAVFEYCGILEASCHVLRDLHRLGQGERGSWLELVDRTVKAAFPPR